MKENEKEFLFKEITYETLGVDFEVHKSLGYGFLEKVYEKALIVSLKKTEKYKRRRTKRNKNRI